MGSDFTRLVYLRVGVAGCFWLLLAWGGVGWRSPLCGATVLACPVWRGVACLTGLRSAGGVAGPVWGGSSCFPGVVLSGSLVLLVGVVFRCPLLRFVQVLVVLLLLVRAWRRSILVALSCAALGGGRAVGPHVGGRWPVLGVGPLHS